MQFLAIVHRFIVKIQLNSTFTNDLKRKEYFRKIFIVADLVSLRIGVFPNILSKLFTYQCCLLIAFANRLDPDQARQNEGHELDPNYLTLW